ncbi:DUF817 family protein [Luteimonas dalianensis]|uniref:DUF817 family protein n=1 Tax=Luteimonas dalianensis TaxID=1148196 RepID=UPI003BF440AA
MGLARFDAWLMDARPPAGLSGPRRFAIEFLWFGLKEARACLFAGLFFACLFLVPREGVLGVPRYDVLLVVMTFTIVAGLKHIKQSIDVPVSVLPAARKQA